MRIIWRPEKIKWRGPKQCVTTPYFFKKLPDYFFLFNLVFGGSFKHYLFYHILLQIDSFITFVIGPSGNLRGALTHKNNKIPEEE